ncbi:MAG: 5-formyltetrahydrofolate cyclo-ligase [Lachnospirales bacterium]
MDKSFLRNYYLNLRKSLKNKETLDEKIFRTLINSREYLEAKSILIYISTSIEVDTIKIINQAFIDNKAVYTPVISKGRMEFYKTDSLDNLTKNSFNIMEVNPSICEKYNYTPSDLIVVPALVYDKELYRIGYGKGYYDKYLENKDLIKVGLIYNDFLVDTIPYASYDVPVNKVISDKL